MKSSIYKSALGNAKVMRNGDLVQVRMGMGGGFLTTQTAFQCVSRWAQSQPSRGSPQMDRSQLFSRIDLIVPELTSLNITTKGSQQTIDKLQKAAKSLGIDTKLFDFPQQQKKAKPSGQDADNATEAADVDSAPAPATPLPTPMSPERFAESRGMSYVSRHSESYQRYLQQFEGRGED